MKCGKKDICEAVASLIRRQSEFVTGWKNIDAWGDAIGQLTFQAEKLVKLAEGIKCEGGKCEKIPPRESEVLKNERLRQHEFVIIRNKDGFYYVGKRVSVLKFSGYFESYDKAEKAALEWKKQMEGKNE